MTGATACGFPVSTDLDQPALSSTRAPVELVVTWRESFELPVSNAVLLQAFDRLRREASGRLAHTDGLFPGYDVLQFAPPRVGRAEVDLEAVLVRDLGTRHLVEYHARIAGQEAGAAKAARSTLMWARGWTLTPDRAGTSETESPS